MTTHTRQLQQYTRSTNNNYTKENLKLATKHTREIRILQRVRKLKTPKQESTVYSFRSDLTTNIRFIRPVIWCYLWIKLLFVYGKPTNTLSEWAAVFLVTECVFERNTTFWLSERLNVASNQLWVRVELRAAGSHWLLLISSSVIMMSIWYASSFIVQLCGPEGVQCDCALLRPSAASQDCCQPLMIYMKYFVPFHSRSTVHICITVFSVTESHTDFNIQ